MSLNQIVNPTTPLNAVFSSVTATVFADLTTSIQSGVQANQAGIIAVSGYSAIPVAVNRTVRFFYATGYSAREVNLSFVADVLNSSLITFDFSIATGEQVEFAQCLLKRSDVAYSPVGSISYPSQNIARVSFAYGTSQLATTNTVTNAHLIMVKPN